MSKLYELPSPFEVETGTVLLHEPPWARAGELRAQLLDESYAKPFVIDDGKSRFLYFNVRLMQSEMSLKALKLLQKNQNGYFLMVEGGRIDHALHETTAKKALQDTLAFDTAIKSVIDEVKKTDPELKNTLIVVTADHDHTMVLNGYAKRTGKTTASNPGVLGLLRNYFDGSVAKDLDGKPFTIIGFGNGENRPAGNRGAFADLTDDIVFANTYHQEAVIRMPAGAETHGGTDVFIGATGMGADQFSGFMDNTKVFSLLRTASGL